MLHWMHAIQTIAVDDTSILSVCLLHVRAVRQRLNVSTSTLDWRLLGTQETSLPLQQGGFDTAFAKLRWPLLLLV